MQKLKFKVKALYKYAVYYQASTSKISESIINRSITTKKIYAKPSDSN